MESERDEYKPITAIVSDDSLLLQEYKKECIKNCIIVNAYCIMINTQLRDKQRSFQCNRKLCKSMCEVIRIHVHTCKVKYINGLVTVD